MALKYIDSMGDHYTAEDAELKWTSTLGLIIRDTGVHGYGLRGQLTKGMLFGSTTIIMEAFIKGGGPLFLVGDTNVSSQIYCVVTGTGAIEVYRSSTNPAVDRIFQSDPDLVRADTWYHFGWKVFIDPTGGSVEVRLNGETLCDLTGVQTTTALGGGVVGPYWSGAIGYFTIGSNAVSCVFDDLVVMDNVDDGINDARLPGGGGFDKFLGPVEIVVKRPNGAGYLTEWTPTPTVANYLNVDDLDPDGDSTYNNADETGVGDSDLFAMENLLPTEDVVGAQSLVLARKTEEGVAAIAKLVRDGGTTTQGTTVYQPSTYSYMITAEPTRPDGSLWNAAAWDAIQYGYKRIV